MDKPPLRFMHASSGLSQAKLALLRKEATGRLLDSLLPGQPGSLKARPDGMILDGHHRIQVLIERGVDVDALAREVIPGEALVREVMEREVSAREVVEREVRVLEVTGRQVEIRDGPGDLEEPGAELGAELDDDEE